MTFIFESKYPNIAYFVERLGQIQIGYYDDGPLTSFIKAIDIGGMVWEGEDEYDTMQEAFQALEAGLVEWMREVGIEPRTM